MKTIVSWSSGKDGAWMVHVLRQRGDIEIGALLTTVNADAQRVAMHAVRVELLETQARALGIPLRQVPIPSPCPNEVYERAMATAVARAVADGFTHVAFADLFLEDIRRYREERLAGTGLTPLFPLFDDPAATPALARTMIAGGLRMVRTRSGGLHVYFAGTTQRNGSLPRAHLDFRAAGGYVLAPPSTVEGAPYELLFSGVGQRQMFDWDAAVEVLAPAAARRSGGGGTGTAGLVAFVSRLEEGERNRGLFWAACRAVDEDHVETLDDLVAAAIGTGLSKTEAARTVASAVRRAGYDSYQRPPV